MLLTLLPLLLPPRAQADELLEKMRRHPARQAAFYVQKYGQKDLARRIHPAPAELIEFLLLDNEKQGFPERPRPATPDAAFLSDLRAAVAEIPAIVRKRVEERLTGIFLVHELGGTAYTDTVTDAHGTRIKAVLVLDIAAIDRKANEWISWKESSPFKAHPDWRLEARIEKPAGDLRRNAIQFIMLHEFGHALTVGERVHPNWDTDLATVTAGQALDFPFFASTWRIVRGGEKANVATLVDDEVPGLRTVRYYQPEERRLPAEAMRDLYASLGKTPFPTLYAATSFMDDFADSLASYVHVVLQKRPYEITVRHRGEPVASYSLDWTAPRLATKRRLIEELLRRPASAPSPPPARSADPARSDSPR
jgi:hypothetical protein